MTELLGKKSIHPMHDGWFTSTTCNKNATEKKIFNSVTEKTVSMWPKKMF